MECRDKLIGFVKKHNLSYFEQFYENYRNHNWQLSVFSLYNDSGCITITCLEQRQELAFYYSKKFYEDIEDLKFKEINVFSYHKEIWEKKLGRFKCFENNKKILSTLIDVMELELLNDDSIFDLITVS